MCRKHNPAHRHRRIHHGMGAVEAEEGFGTIVVPQVCPSPPHGGSLTLDTSCGIRALHPFVMVHPHRAGDLVQEHSRQCAFTRVVNVSAFQAGMDNADDV